MRSIFSIVLGTFLVAASPASGADEGFFRPALYAQLAFGGGKARTNDLHVGLRLDPTDRARNLLNPQATEDAWRQVSGGPYRSELALGSPALAQWDLSRQRAAWSAGGLELASVSFPGPDDPLAGAAATGLSEARRKRMTTGITIGAAATVLAVGVAVWSLEGFEEFGEALGDLFDWFGDDDDGNSSSGSDDSDGGSGDGNDDDEPCTIDIGTGCVQ